MSQAPFRGKQTESGGGVAGLCRGAEGGVSVVDFVWLFSGRSISHAP